MTSSLLPEGELTSATFLVRFILLSDGEQPARLNLDDDLSKLPGGELTLNDLSDDV